jgi:tetratricopeptide (TPR) repeat protein
MSSTIGEEFSEEEVSALRRLISREGIGKVASDGFELTGDELEALRDQAGKIAATAEAAAKAALGQPEAAAGLFEAGKIWEFTNMPGMAINLYQRALKIDPNFNDATVRLAVNLMRSGRTQEGLRLATDLAARAPDYRFKTIKGDLTVTTMTLLGDALRVTGDIEGAIRAYEQALESEPGDAHSAARLAELYLVQGRIDQAAALEQKLDDTFNVGLKAMLRLAANDRRMLPAITQIRLNAAVNAPVV